MHRLFVAHLHSPVGGYVIGQRLRAAQSLLQNSSYPIKEIAARIGYSSQLYFATEFKRLTGETPGDYRRRQKFSRTFEFNRARRNGGRRHRPKRTERRRILRFDGGWLPDFSSAGIFLAFLFHFRLENGRMELIVCACKPNPFFPENVAHAVSAFAARKRVSSVSSV